MSKNKERIFLALTLVICVLLFAERLTGEICHAILGVLLIVVVGGHICTQMVKMRYQKTSVRVVDQVLIAALLILFATGILMHPLQGILILKILHKLSAVVFVLAIIGHVIQHRTETSGASKTRKK